VIGDAVNEAARLTEKAKQVRGRILASDAVVSACTAQERADWEPYRSLRLRGRDERTQTWTARPATMAPHAQLETPPRPA
jgi:adenylate cyclase